MDRVMIVRHLEMARRHVAAGEKVVAQQRELVAKLDSDGHNTIEARRLLASFEATQDLHVADYARIEAELADLDAGR